MKLIFVITGLSTGGSEMMLYKLCRGLVGAGYDIKVVSLTGAGTIGRHIESLGIPVETLEFGKSWRDVIKFFNFVKWLKQENPQIVQTWMYHADLVGGLASRLAGIKKVVWGIRQSNLSPDLNRKGTLIVARLCAWLSELVPCRIVCCSYSAKESHARFGYAEDAMTVIPNGFDLREFRPDSEAGVAIRNELRIDCGPMVGLVARFDIQKNHKGFIEAAAYVHEAIPDAHFVMAGSDISWENETLVNWIDSGLLRNKFRLLGQRSDVSKLTASFDVAVCSSWGEGFPNVLGEAMSCGVPCVVTDVGDCSEIVGDTGRVVSAGDMRALADRIVGVLNMQNGDRVRLGEAARKRILDEFSIDAVVKRYELLYVLLVNEVHS